MVATRRKPRWTIEEWTAFGKRCQGLQYRIMLLIRTFPISPGGAKRYHLGMLSKTYLRLLKAMQETEKVIDRQYPELNEWNPDHYESRSSSDIIHGQEKEADSAVSAYVADSTLSREQWIEIGIEVRAIEAACGNLAHDLYKTAYAPAGLIDRYLGVRRQIETFKLKLHDIACDQHPDWRTVGRVFYGKLMPEP